jgi:hypothetical protein
MMLSVCWVCVCHDTAEGGNLGRFLGWEPNTSKTEPKRKQDWFLTCMQGSGDHPLAVCRVVTLRSPPPALDALGETRRGKGRRLPRARTSYSASVARLALAPRARRSVNPNPNPNPNPSRARTSYSASVARLALAPRARRSVRTRLADAPPACGVTVSSAVYVTPSDSCKAGPAAAGWVAATAAGALALAASGLRRRKVAEAPALSDRQISPRPLSRDRFKSWVLKFNKTSQQLWFQFKGKSYYTIKS